jgi:hypothetical protein
MDDGRTRMTTPRKPSSVRVDESNGRPAWLPWLIGLLLLGLLALLLWFLLGDDDDDVAVDTPAVSQEAEPDVEPDAEPEPEVVVPETNPLDDVEIDVTDVPEGGALAGEVDVFGDQLTGSEIVGQTVTANEVLVQELVADEAFYVGPEIGNTILVRLESFAGEDAPESPFQVEQGGRVTFTGELREIDEQFLSDLQLFDGADGLELGDYYVQADQISSVG